MGPIDHLIFLVLVLVLPIRAAANFRKMARAPDADVPRVRLRAYRLIIVGQWVLALGVIALWIALRRPWAAIGLAPRAAGGLTASVVVLAAAWAGLTFRQLAIKTNAAVRARALRQFEKFERILPHSQHELRWFAAVAITAGVCEELLYRGFLFCYLRTALDLGPAIAVGALVFGLAHFYQGSRGILLTGLVGAVMFGLYMFSGSLFVPMAVHALVDFYAGWAARAVFQGTPAAAGAATVGAAAPAGEIVPTAAPQRPAPIE
ncbi:MAG: CPBP family intramembrane metalloprotease [Deltaproteobacteria bacterium]|nr:MAG: CPBP family intramembrane metalloprotease [Deltaproteobacteria bacterium]